MLTTHAAGSATAPPIASCSFVFRVVGFIIDDLKKNNNNNTGKGTPSIIRPNIHFYRYLYLLNCLNESREQQRGPSDCLLKVKAENHLMITNIRPDKQ